MPNCGHAIRSMGVVLYMASELGGASSQQDLVEPECQLQGKLCTHDPQQNRGAFHALRPTVRGVVLLLNLEHCEHRGVHPMSRHTFAAWSEHVTHASGYEMRSDVHSGIMIRSQVAVSYRSLPMSLC
jgi:hypothetical protein